MLEELLFSSLTYDNRSRLRLSSLPDCKERMDLRFFLFLCVWNEKIEIFSPLLTVVTCVFVDICSVIRILEKEMRGKIYSDTTFNTEIPPGQ